MKLFEKVKEIRDRKGELYFERYAIFEIENFASLYIHKIHKHDKDKHCHTHPWNFFGMILKGSYYEDTDISVSVKKPFRPFWGSRDYCHRISGIVDGPVTTLFFVWGKYKPWHYSKGKIHFAEYRRLKNENNLPQSRSQENPPDQPLY